MFNFLDELATLRPKQREAIVDTVHQHYPGLKYVKGDLGICDPDFGYQVAMNIVDQVWVFCEYPFIEDEDDITPDMIPDCEMVDMATIPDMLREEWIKGYYDNLDLIRDQEMVIAECAFEQGILPIFRRSINSETLSMLTANGTTSVELALSVMNVIDLFFPNKDMSTFKLSAGENKSYDAPLFLNIAGDTWISSGRSDDGSIRTNLVDIAKITIKKWDTLSKAVGYDSIPDMINGCGRDWSLPLVEGLYAENLFPDYLKQRRIKD